jgi:flavin-dependent dehydrogenase
MPCDVVIVGASSAGLYAGELLARAGRTVHIYDEHGALAPARRTLIVTPRLLQWVQPLPPGALLHRAYVMALASPQAQAQVRLRQPDLIVERAAFVQALARRAQEAGAEVHLGCRLVGLEPHPEGALLTFHHTATGGEERVVARAVLGADGVGSRVAHLAGLPLPPTVPLLQAEVELPGGWSPTVVQCWFDVEATPYFFWGIPAASSRGVVGLIGPAGEDPRPILERFLARQGLRPLAYQSGRVALHHPCLRPWGKVGEAPVLLVGDAAGHVKVTTVGGTVTGLWGAQAAARSLLAGLPYARALRPLKRELDLHWLIRQALDGLRNPDYDALLGALNQPLERFLAQRNRDQMAWAFFRTLVLQPRLALLGARGLLRSALRSSLGEGQAQAQAWERSR